MLNHSARLDHRKIVLLVALPFIIFLYPSVAMLAARSTIPIYLNRYSWNLLFFNSLNVAIYCTLIWGFIARQQAIQAGAVLSLIVLALAVLSNNSLLGLSAIEEVTQTTRLLGGFALMVIAFLAEKSGRLLLARCCLVLGVFFGLTAFFDFSWGVISRFLPTQGAKQIDGHYRTTYDLESVKDSDIVLVGDSFVWGAGVPLEQRFGDVLEQRLQAGVSQPRVYSLGVIGEDVAGYIRQIQDVPSGIRAKQVFICFYANDMPPRSNLQDSLQQIAVAVGRGSITMRMVADLARIAVTPNAENYAALMLSHFDERDKTFPIRWHQLEGELSELFQLAKERSHERPSLVLLPVLSDFQKAAFEEPLRRVGQLAERIGFRVIDTMPAFRADGHAAKDYRASPNDLHLNERGNRIVAELLFGVVAQPPAP
jgi:lysophospholipase L1-like esterase